MPKILVLYYSRSGNTEKMAKAVAEGSKSVSSAEVELTYYIDADELTKFDAVLVGTPTYNHGIAIDIKSLFEEAAAKGTNLKGKAGAAFGSYGWSGEAPAAILEIMKNKFDMKVSEQPLLANYTPDQNKLKACYDLGKRVSQELTNSA
jgi:flavodoxin I